MNIDLIKRKLLVKYPSFGTIIANTSINENNNIDTAATNGKEIIYNTSFVNKLSDDEKVFLFAHEVCHIAFSHVKRRKDKNNKLWNIATDAVINTLLENDGLKIIKGGIDITERFGIEKSDILKYNAEDLYEILLKQAKDNNDDLSDISDECIDNHDIWDESKEMGSSGSSLNDDEKDNKMDDNGNDEKEKEIEESTKKGENKAFEDNKKQKLDNLKKLRKELVNKQAGNSTNSLNRSISNIGNSKPLINWKVLLKEATVRDYDYSYKNATVEYGVFTPNLEGIPIAETEIVLDTSGSISEDLLRNFLRECKNILFESKLSAGCFDTMFYGFNEIRNEKDIENMPIIGGGGTDFDTAISAFSYRVDNKIIFTDGYADMPKDYCDAIWIVFGDEKIKPNGGKVIYISNEELRKLERSNNKSR